ncbi:CRAL/TRIO domain-containing protein [Hirsutella rhossiliensis]|uniref:CRAL/TRIO domain-containing protein n=1 Tax=Hirsutella rhossiliensis TaxID=111463 RepID=A0A9P8MRJ6_9HYPO|nr:CRAL/TRIO domain-containing protein [Hirsutella rhossiliensis]KAH0960092.1 CRAL/TRIO domain-containing protein [Hirsutella rhossiliensis]
MPPTTAAPGHIGNLTVEQQEKLRQLWNEIFKLCGVADPEEDPESPQKKRFSLFRRKNAESSPTSNGSAPEAKDGTDSNDKHGQTKQFQKTLESQTPESIRETIWSMVKQDNPDALVLRFLRARKWDVQQALVMLVSAMHWRHTEMHVDSDIMKNGEAGAVQDEQTGSAEAKKLASDFMAQSRQGKSFLHGLDKEGRPICVVRARLHKPSAQSAESLERYTVFIIETARLALEPPVDTATIIFDMTGFSLANMDYHPVKFMIQCFEANYPESLGAILVHNAPWVFQGIWRIIRGWLDPVVAAKVHFTNYKAGLEEFIEPSRIIKELEGEEDWEYKYEEPVEGENDMMKDTETRDRLLGARAELYKQFEAETRTWIRAADSEEGKQAKAQRDKIAEQMRVGYWELDPYLRSRSLYDRQGIILPGGRVNWYKWGDRKETAPQTNGTAGDASASMEREA